MKFDEKTKEALKRMALSIAVVGALILIVTMAYVQSLPRPAAPATGPINYTINSSQAGTVTNSVPDSVQQEYLDVEAGLIPAPSPAVLNITVYRYAIIDDSSDLTGGV